MKEQKNALDTDRRNLLFAGGAVAMAGMLSASSASAEIDPRKGDFANRPKDRAPARVGTIKSPNYWDRIDFREDDVAYKQKNYSYIGPKGAVVGLVSSLLCTLDRPSRDVWPFIKDFNSFEGPFGIRYILPNEELVAWGDLYDDVDHELGQQIWQYAGEKGTWKSGPCRMLRVIPEHLIAIQEMIVKDGSPNNISRGFSTITVHEHVGKSHVAMMLEHAERLDAKTELEALEKSMWGPKLYDYSVSLGLWKDKFIPKLKELVYSQPQKS